MNRQAGRSSLSLLLLFTCSYRKMQRLRHTVNFTNTFCVKWKCSYIWHLELKASFIFNDKLMYNSTSMINFYLRPHHRHCACKKWCHSACIKAALKASKLRVKCWWNWLRKMVEESDDQGAKKCSAKIAFTFPTLLCSLTRVCICVN